MQALQLIAQHLMFHVKVVDPNAIHTVRYISMYGYVEANYFHFQLTSTFGLLPAPHI